MSAQWQKVKEILQTALECPSDEREQFLDEVCGGDESLRREVETLLLSAENVGGFMEQATLGKVAEMFVGTTENSLQMAEFLNHYRILSNLGAGGMGEVYLAEDTKLNRFVALKLLPQSKSADEDANRRLLREARSAAALDHPHICHIHEIAETDGRSFIVMQFCEGETLAEKLEKGIPELSETLDLAIQIADALDNAHSHQIIHRDIKPANIIVNQNGQAKILDFGLAKIIAERRNVESEAVTANISSADNLIIGTAPYMSPEQMRGKPLDARTDIFSFGAMLYEMLSGKQVFKCESQVETIAAILHFEPPIAKMLADAPLELQLIVRKSLAKDKEERYQTAKDLLIDLQNIRQELYFQNKLERMAEPHSEAKTEILDVAEITDKRPSAEITTSRSKNRRLGFIIGAIVLLFAVVGFGYWFFNTKQIESIAVLPFVNESGNADVEYLSDGMTETLISSLSQIPNLNVKARSSVFRYKGKNTDTPTIGKELNVQAILNGTVVQRGQDLALHIELVDSQTETVLWSADYKQPMTNLVALQSDITHDVSDKLKIKLSGADEQKLAKNYTENSEAYQLYLKGRYYWYKSSPKDYEKSRDYYQQAIDVDPNYALAFAGLSGYYGFAAANGIIPPSDENWSKAAAAANKALALDDKLPEAYNVFAGVTLYYYGDWVRTERILKQAIELNPNCVELRNHYAVNLQDFGRLDDALTQMKIVLELDPLSVRFNLNLARLFYYLRQYDRAIKQYQKTLELDPNDVYTHELLGDAYEQKGMQKEAFNEWSKALRLTEDNKTAAMLERTFAASGFNAALRALWQKKLERLNEKTGRGEYVPAMNFALAYTRLANKEQAFAWLAKAEHERSRLIYDVKLDPIYDSLRDDSRFQELLKKVG